MHTLPAKYLKTLLLFAGKNDSRAYLNSIYLTGHLAVATDGHRVGVFNIEGMESPDIIIPRHMIESLKLTAKGDVTVDVGDGGCVTLAYNGLSATGGVMTEKYPDFRRILPTSVSGVAAQFNGQYLSDLHTAYKILHGGTFSAVHIGHNGDGGALIGLCDDNFAGVLMPLRLVHKGLPPIPAGLPSWL